MNSSSIHNCKDRVKHEEKALLRLLPQAGNLTRRLLVGVSERLRVYLLKPKADLSLRAFVSSW